MSSFQNYKLRNVSPEIFPEILSIPNLENPNDLITTREIDFLFDFQSKLYNSDKNLQKHFEDGKKNQLIEQKKILSEMSICPIQKITEYSNILSSLDAKKVKNLVSNQYFNPKVMESVMCLTDTILYISPEHQRNKSLRDWISKLKQFGEPSVSGYALKGSLKGKSGEDNIAEDIFVIKAPQKDKYNDELVHEAFVGMTCLNPLRDYIPNFTYIYGLFQCSGPIIDPNTKEVISWCQNNGNTNYLLMENISNAVTFKEFVATSSLNDFVSLYLQTLYALRTGHLKSDFTHYDLHGTNVLIRDVPMIQDRNMNQKVAIPYETENGLEYWIGSKIATIIDYGRVHVQYQGKNYGYWDYPEYYIYPDRSYLLYDAYKLLGFLLFNIKKNNPKIFDEASKILKFFNTSEDNWSFIDKNLYNYYSLPLTKKIANEPFDDLMIYIRTIYDCSSFLSSKPHNYPILSCQNDKFCLTQNGITKEIGFADDQEYVPKSIFELCDLIKRVEEGPSQKDDYLNLIENFDIEEILLNTEQEFKDLANSVNQNLNEISSREKSQLKGLEIGSILNDIGIDIDSYRDNVFKTAKTLSQIETLQTIFESYDCVVNVYNEPKYNQYAEILKNQVADFYNKINPYLNVILDDIDYILPYENMKNVLIAILKVKTLPQTWYWETFPKFKYMKNYLI